MQQRFKCHVNSFTLINLKTDEMDKYEEKYSLSKASQKETENFNHPVITKELKSTVFFLKKISHRPRCFMKQILANILISQRMGQESPQIIKKKKKHKR